MSKFNYKNLEEHKVQSSNLDWVAYDESNEILYIAFLPKGEDSHGSIYAYENVPKDIFEGLLNAGSHGRYFWVKIRNKNYPYTKLD